MLEVRDLKKSFGSLPVLRGVSLKMEKGDVTAVIGPSGGGKTTLLRCMNFLESADSGTLVFDGVAYDLSRVSRRDMAAVRMKTGFVFQSFNLFSNKTAVQNVTEGLIVARHMPRDAANALAMQALDRVGLRDRADHYPSQLSGGQQQRVAIAQRARPRADRRGALRDARPGGQRHDHAGGHARNALRPRGFQPRDLHGKRRHRGAGAVQAILRRAARGAHPGISADDLR